MFPRREKVTHPLWVFSSPCPQDPVPSLPQQKKQNLGMSHAMPMAQVYHGGPQPMHSLMQVACQRPGLWATRYAYQVQTVQSLFYSEAMVPDAAHPLKMLKVQDAALGITPPPPPTEGSSAVPSSNRAAQSSASSMSPANGAQYTSTQYLQQQQQQRQQLQQPAAAVQPVAKQQQQQLQQSRPQYGYSPSYAPTGSSSGYAAPTSSSYVPAPSVGYNATPPTYYSYPQGTGSYTGASPAPTHNSMYKSTPAGSYAPRQSQAQQQQQLQQPQLQGGSIG